VAFFSREKVFLFLCRNDLCGVFSSLCHHNFEAVMSRSVGDVLNPRIKSTMPLLIFDPRTLFLNPPNSGEDSDASKQANLS